MTGRRFSQADDIRLIHCVETCPELYDRRNNYTYTHVRFKDAWQAIAEQLGKPEDACKGRWRDIRDHYFKLRRRIVTGNQTNTKWYLYDKLYFLENVKKKKWTKSNTRPPGNEQEADQSEDSGTHHLVPSGALKTEHDLEPEICFKVEEHFISPEYVSTPFTPEADESHQLTTGDEAEEDDDVDLFMRSIAMTVKRFSPPKKAEAKLKILHLVSEMEFPTLSPSYKNTG